MISKKKIEIKLLDNLKKMRINNFGDEILKDNRTEVQSLLKNHVLKNSEETITIDLNGQKLFLTPMSDFDGLTFVGGLVENNKEIVCDNSENKGKFELLGEMASGIAHDINNPLNIIIASFQVVKFKLQESNLNDEEILSFIDDGEEAVSRIVDISESMKNFVRENQSNLVDCNLKKMLNKSVSFCKTFLNKHNITLTINGYEIKTKCKDILLSQVVINLIKNASDALEKASFADKWIELNLKEDNGMVIIDVIDGGKGIDASIASKIFNRAFTTKDPTKGTGLGLSMAKTILKDHGGDIELVSDSKNTHFKLYFPKK